MTIENDIRDLVAAACDPEKPPIKCHSCDAVADDDEPAEYVIINEYERDVEVNWRTPYLRAHLCDDCIGNSYEVLESGEAIVAEQAVYTIDGEWIHIDDSINCDSCFETYMSDNMNYLEYRDSSICHSCIENGDYVWVDGGYELRHIDDAEYCDHCEDWYSPGHERDCDYSSSYLKPYDADVFDYIDYRAMVKGAWMNNFRSQLVFGVELETDSRDDRADDIAEHLYDATNWADYGICKSDGTVSGPELVTLPADLQSHQQQYSWSKWCDELRPLAKGHHANSAGIHVHINRSAVSALTLGKMLVFVNDDNSTEFIESISQRSLDTSWCEKKRVLGVGSAGKRPAMGKYSAINVTQKTIEMRIFRSSLLPERVLKNIEFCHALVSWCRDTSVKALTASNMVQFISNNRKTYPNLSTFISDRIEA